MPRSSQDTQLLLADDSAQRLSDLRGAIERTPGLTCRGSARDIHAARRLFAQDGADMLITNLYLHNEPAFDLITESQGRLRVLVLTPCTAQADVMQALLCGARGYLSHQTPWPLVVEAIGNVLAGEAPLSPLAGHHLLCAIRSQTESGRDDDAPRIALSSREKAVLENLARGHTYETTGGALAISTNTVRYHVKQIYAKLDVTSRSQAIYKAIRLGLMSLRSD